MNESGDSKKNEQGDSIGWLSSHSESVSSAQYLKERERARQARIQARESGKRAGVNKSSSDEVDVIGKVDEAEAKMELSDGDCEDQRSEENERTKLLMQVLPMMPLLIFGFAAGNFMRWVRANSEVELNPLTWFSDMFLGPRWDVLPLIILLGGIGFLIKVLRKDDEEAALGVDPKARVLTMMKLRLVVAVLVGAVFGSLIWWGRSGGVEYNPLVVLWKMVFPIQGGG